ncbi:hypothetical protein SSP531S_12910 [Streptomyces spongiicola]|uniref:Uncharacterized protein n=1 Tax=Streptomyces spongiicola TaxID=1690221 RepID=A0A388STK8_9ACTN|nr:hypothetical protein SSP531S_12910 [Streptomyces spongiicola]
MATLKVSMYEVKVQLYRSSAPRSAVRLGPAVAVIDWSVIDIALVSSRDPSRRGKRGGSGPCGGVAGACPGGRPAAGPVIGHSWGRIR